MQTSIVALLGLACLFLGWLLMFLLPGSRVFAWAILTLGTALLGTAFVIDFARVKKSLSSGRGRFGLGATLTTSLFIGIVLLANGVSVGVNRRFDLTGLSQFTLTSQTKEVLANLDEPVEVVTLFTPKIPPLITGYAQNLLAEYKVYSDKITVKAIDPELQPDQARQYGLDRVGAIYGAVVFESESGRRQVYGPQIAGEAEHAFTSALLEVTGTEQKTVYFLTGHGEASVQQEYSAASDGLKDNLFKVGQVDLLRTGAVPEDATVLVIAGPREPLATGEAAILQDYLEQNGRLFVLLDPDPPSDFVELLAKWWVDVERGVLIDPTSYVAPNKDNPLVPRSRNSLQLGETFFTGATAVVPRQDKPDTAELSALIWTSTEAWLDKDSAPGQEATLDPSIDREGPLAIGALVSTGPADQAEGTRLAVIGDSDFASNPSFRNGSNSDLFLTAVNWLAAGAEIISIDRKVLVTRRLLLNPEQARFLNVSSIGLLPLLFLLSGALVWWRRR